jgi:hypothetical protein
VTLSDGDQLFRVCDVVFLSFGVYPRRLGDVKVNFLCSFMV